MQEALRKTGERVRSEWLRRNEYLPQAYDKPARFGRRDAFFLGASIVACSVVYVAHDVLHWPVPLPSDETIGFVGTVAGLYIGRTFKP